MNMTMHCISGEYFISDYRYCTPPPPPLHTHISIYLILYGVYFTDSSSL